MDYLQVFELSTQQFAGIKIQRIVHRQEQPPYKKSWQWDSGQLPVRDVTVWIVDSGPYCTMMLPSEY
ncbi:hypothetical protein JOE45_003478 [Paenibacillus sp. PvR098]|nr:hypothetical protein [Paenibacillus sp. PvP091]MBP1171577.1 hypothetical protein [Paenibacillus sp. PvR098]MBP2437958.1 hypothetical protein [Paenibacillus sp. PvP052]